MTNPERQPIQIGNQSNPEPIWKRLSEYDVYFVASAGVLLALAGVNQVTETLTMPGPLLEAAAVLLAGWKLIPKAWRSLLRFKLNIHVLIVIAVLGAIGLGQWFEAALAAILFSLSEWLEDYSQSRARKSIDALLALTPDTASVVTEEGAEVQRRVKEIQPGERVLIRPGERVPLDGAVEQGASAVDESPITGEPVPVDKSAGSKVFAGSINQDGSLTILIEKPYADCTISRVVRLVEQARKQKTDIENTIETFARYYTPFIILTALSFMVIGPLMGGDFRDWFYRSLVVMVVGCPCAFLISTPVTVLASLASAARNGVLIKGGRFLEAISHVRAVAFDKTGTLTAGHPQVDHVSPWNGYQENDVLNVAAAIGRHSQHPLARSVMEYIRPRGIKPVLVEEFVSTPGKGASANIRGEKHLMGSMHYLRESGAANVDEALSAHDCGQTSVGVSSASGLIGSICFHDPVREDSKKTITMLHELGVERIVMLTGDRAEAAHAVAKILEVDEIHAQLLPQDKVDRIELLTRETPPSVMVGDGVNDAPALAASSIGVAIGAKGSDIALESAPMVLLADDLTKLPWIIRHSRRARSVIMQNIVLALAIKFGFVLLASLGLASLWLAVMADVGAAVLVIGNGLRMLNSDTEQIAKSLA
ncbi:MAG: cadmium-translocating P-type ATPase [bacterium]|nr:cadmium-translocating P-type ATPase [bacterium]